MPVRHNFVSPKLDDVDISLVRPSDWNAGHIVELGLPTYSIYKSGATYYAVKGIDGITAYHGSDAGDIINSAIIAAGTGLIKLASSEVYEYDVTPFLGYAPIILEGCGMGGSGGSAPATTLQPQSVMANSISITKPECQLRNLCVDGNSLAAQVQIMPTGDYALFDHVFIKGHTIYNLLSNRFGITLNCCGIEGKPVYHTSGNLFRIINSWLNGGGVNGCLYVATGHETTLIGNSFESYAGTYCMMFNPGTCQGIFIAGNGFESSYTCTTLIHVQAAQGLTIVGNMQATDAGVTNSLNLLYGDGVLAKANRFTKLMLVSITSANVDIQAGVDAENTITYNSITGLKALKKVGARAIIERTTVPAVGTWAVGDECINTAPTPDGISGSVVTAAGTPGTWASKQLGVPASYVTTIVATGVSNVLENSNDADKWATAVTYAKKKEIKLNADMAFCRIKFDLEADTTSEDVFGRIYKNGVAIGTERTRNGTGGVYETFTEDFAGFVSGDLIQIYIRTSVVLHGVHVKNMRFYYDSAITHIAGMELSTPVAVKAGAISVTNQDP